MPNINGKFGRDKVYNRGSESKHKQSTQQYQAARDRAMNSFKLLKLIVLFLVTLVIMKFFSSSNKGRVKINSKIMDMDTNIFWWNNYTPEPENLDAPKEPPKAEKNLEKKIIKKEPEPNPEEPHNLDSPVEPKEAKKKPVIENVKKEPEPNIEEEIEIIEVPVKPSTGPLRLVHLDLKGAAPKVSYLKQIFPLFSSLGAHGILIEYEDMFPYEGELEILKSPFAYSVEDIEEIKTLANLNKLELIPLMQVFGHLEFVLKHEKYAHLREVPKYPNSLNALAPDSLPLLKNMLKQILKRHPEARFFHIGADEVYELGESEDSKRWLEKNNGDVGALYLSHVSNVCHLVTEMRPGMKMIFWDDMIRKISVPTLQTSDVPKLAFPMIWNYNPQIDMQSLAKLLEKYRDAGFLGVWFASSFKGTSGVDQRWTPLKHHLDNHLSWLKVMDSMDQYPSLTFQGIAITGWQRYEHFTRLCELLPVAIPSLAVCLQTLKYGSFNEEAVKAVHHILGCNIKLDPNICEGSGSFVGAEIYHKVRKIHTELQSSIDSMMTDHFLRGSLSNYLRKYNFANPRNLRQFKTKLRKLQDDWESMLETFRKEMEAIFYPDTVEEWMEDNVNEQMTKLRSMVQDTERIYDLDGRKKSLNT
ncbi:beta-N-acetylhexosaminidase isoform X1 [Pygocentrus nattereri]|uniref:beta-N-acetylhexosaminidase isoform X1 n=1 Tax=Pygocentrus nattereri TaxID=42514 RepID=UPI0008147201|nr:beta-N-acetylhexosaminidase isoform X1 [Pygocentrus nattereri]